MSALKISYSVIAPIYDLVIEKAMQDARVKSLGSLPRDKPGEVLISGIGTGLDLPFLPALHRYTALDFNAAMLSRAMARKTGLEISWLLGNSMALPFADRKFDHVVLHLIAAVVPEPGLCLAEAARVLKPGGSIVLLDKFLRKGQAAPLRRMLTPLSRNIATRMDVVFEDMLQAAPGLEVVSDVPLLGGGWFRGILLRKVTQG
jgi:ubiquinone/menaquinone biosynthesis C-methylase UbiE